MRESPTVDLSIETDFIEGIPNETLNSPAWERGIETNYALYGIDIDIQRDQSFDDRAVPSAPRRISTDADQYMAVTTEGRFPGTGFNGYATTESYTGGPLPGSGMYIYAETIADSAAPSRVDPVHLNRSPYENEMQVVAAHVAMHEIAHSFGAGELDDKGAGLLPFDEVYSGYSGSRSTDDPTIEALPGRDTDWSIMRLGWDSLNPIFYHDNRLYYAFSIEETVILSEP